MPEDTSSTENSRSGRIESIQFGAGFLMVQGWVLVPEGATAPAALTLAHDGLEHRVTGLYPRTDVGAADGGSIIGFNAAIAAGEARGSDSRIELIGPSGTIESVELRSFGFRSFRPQGAIDSATAETIAGWVFDPGTWHGQTRQDALQLTIAGLTLPITLDVRRYDLPFSAARAGRPLGFQVNLFELITRIYGREEATKVRAQGQMEIALVANGFQLASSTISLETVAPDTKPDTSSAPESSNIADDGVIEIRAYSENLGGWLFYGWVRREHARKLIGPQPMVVDGDIAGESQFIIYQRADLGETGFGLLGFFRCDQDEGVNFSQTHIGGSQPVRLRGFERMRLVGERDAIEGMRAIVRDTPRANATPLAGLLRRPLYEGVDTVNQLGRPIYMEIDELVEAPGEGAMLIGWFVDPTNLVQTLRLRAPGHISEPLFDRWLRFDRPDIVEALGKELGLEHNRWGYQTYAALPGFDRTQAYVEMTLTDGTIAFKPLPKVARSGRAGILRALGDLDLKTGDFKAAMDVVAPAVAGISRHKLASAGPSTDYHAGDVPENPRCSVIIPLYGRLDFLSYQTALFSEHDRGVDEYIFVLDQPERAAECLAIAKAAYQRVQMPFRLLVLPENLGFAGASNAGLSAARGDYVCFLNSDVMPKTPDWLDQLIAAFDEDEELGLISTRLLFEDGTIQHMGMDLERKREFGNMMFPMHPGKGRRPPPPNGVRDVPLVTGALMVMKREIATACGGFDSRYAIGDFEDADLCMKVRDMGLRCAVHDDVELYHLERQSQGASSNNWRINLTLVNAWSFGDRWARSLESAAASTDSARIA